MKIGIDLVRISRFEQMSDHFAERMLTSEEKEEYLLLPEDKKNVYLAGRWAAKEAIFKATGTSDYLKFSVLHDESGRPYVKGRSDMDISISHDGDYATAAVIVF